MKVFSNSGNAGRAAKKALGPTAKPKVDFVTKKVEGGYVWEVIGDWPQVTSPLLDEAKPTEAKPAKPAKAPKAKKPKRVKGDAKIEDQPQMRRIVEMCSRKTGATIEDIATRFECEQHTVRGAMSRLRNEADIEFLPVRIGRKKVFFSGPDRAANAKEHTPAAAE